MEVTSTQRDRDYILAVNWKAAEQAIRSGKYKMVDGAKVIDPRDAPGVAFLVPCSKSPHGVDVTPDGKYFVGSGKLVGITTIFSFAKLQQAIAAKNFSGNEDGIPVVNYDAVKEAEVNVGLGPLHTQCRDGYVNRRRL